MMNPVTLSLVLISFAVFLQLLSVALPYWTSNSISHSGLWVTCLEDSCFSNLNKNVPPHFKALQSLQVLGLAAGFSAIVTIIIGKFTKVLRPVLIRVLTAVHCLSAGVIILIGIIEFDIKEYSMSACFAMSLFSAFVCAFVGGRLSVTDEH